MVMFAVREVVQESLGFSPSVFFLVHLLLFSLAREAVARKIHMLFYIS